MFSPPGPPSKVRLKSLSGMSGSPSKVTKICRPDGTAAAEIAPLTFSASPPLRSTPRSGNGDRRGRLDEVDVAGQRLRLQRRGGDGARRPSCRRGSCRRRSRRSRTGSRAPAPLPMMSVGSVTTAFFRPASSIVCEIDVVSSTGSARSLLTWRIFAPNFGAERERAAVGRRELVLVGRGRAAVGVGVDLDRLDAARGRVAEEALAAVRPCPSASGDAGHLERRRDAADLRRVRDVPEAGVEAEVALAERGRLLEDDLRQGGAEAGHGGGVEDDAEPGGLALAGLDVVDLPARRSAGSAAGRAA